MKSARTVVGPGDPVHLDPRVGQVMVEGELVAVVGRTCRHLAAEDVPGALLGWTIANDVTALEQVPLDSMFTQVKNGDVVLTGAPGTSAPIRAGRSTAITLAGIGTLTNPAVAASAPGTPARPTRGEQDDRNRRWASSASG